MKIQRLIFLIFTTIVVFACVTDHPSPQVLKISEKTPSGFPVTAVYGN